MGWTFICQSSSCNSDQMTYTLFLLILQTGCLEFLFLEVGCGFLFPLLFICMPTRIRNLSSSQAMVRRSLFSNHNRSSGSVVVKLLDCRSKRPWFDSRSRRYDFRDWLSPASSRDTTEIPLKRRKSSKQPTNSNHKTNIETDQGLTTMGTLGNVSICIAHAAVPNCKQPGCL